MQNRISDFQFLRSALRFTIARSTRATAFAIHRVARRIAPRLVRELALDALQPRAGEQPSGRSVDALLVHAIETDTRLLFFREDVIVFAGERCSLDTIGVFKAARPELAARIEDLFGVEVSGSTRDVAEREGRVAAARADRPSTAPRLEPAPPADVVLAPWDVDAESIPPRREPVVFQPSRLRRAGAQRPCPPDRDEPNDAEVRSGLDDDSAARAAPARDCTDRDAANPTPLLPRSRGRAPDPNVSPRQDDSTASQETPQ